MVSEIFDPSRWEPVAGFEFTDITYHRAKDQGTVRSPSTGPRYATPFGPTPLMSSTRHLITPACPAMWGRCCSPATGPRPKMAAGRFVLAAISASAARMATSTPKAKLPRRSIRPGRRLHILEVQRLIRFMPKVVIAVVPGWAVGGGHSLHVVCDLTLASAEHAVFKQTDADVASFDAGFRLGLPGSPGRPEAGPRDLLPRHGLFSHEAVAMGMANRAVPHAELENVALEWAATINAKSPTAQRMLKFAFNLIDDGLVGQQLFAGEATRLAYGSDEAQEGRDAFLEKRPQDFTGYPWHF